VKIVPISKKYFFVKLNKLEKKTSVKLAVGEQSATLLKEMGSNTCPQSAVDGYDQRIRKSSVEDMNLICRRYEDNDEKYAQLFFRISEKKPKTLRKHHFFTFLMFLIQSKKGSKALIFQQLI
jgi:hypothetical protein